MLCGLHTCGDLACSTLRKFVTGNASVVVNVGCCYQWLTETAVLDTYSELSSLGSRTVDNPNHHRDDDASDAESGRLYGFPLSQALTNASASLGRKARGLANQSLDRWPESQADLDSLFTRHFYRAALQIILDEFVTSPRNDAQTKWTPILGALPAGAHASFVTYCHGTCYALLFPRYLYLCVCVCVFVQPRWTNWVFGIRLQTIKPWRCTIVSYRAKGR